MKNKYYENETFNNYSFEGEILEEYEFTECTFIDCTVCGCTVSRCRFNECMFRGCSFKGIKSSYSEVSFGVFEKCVLDGINWRTLLPEVPLACPVERLTECRMRYNTFFKISLNRFDFSGNEIVKSEFTECALAKCCFRGCELSGTEFFRCDLADADFRDAHNYRIDIDGSRLKNARFSYPDVMGLLEGLGIKIE